MTFGAPQWFWALALLPTLLALFVWNETRRRELLRALVAARLQPELTASVSSRKRWLRFLVSLAGLACVIGALAQPRWGYTFEQAKRKGRDVIIAIDSSKSMLANDLAPNRLMRAKLAAQDLINALQGDRVGVIAFAGTAFLQAPLTIDYSAVLSTIHELDTNIIPQGGTDITAAIKVATEAFGKGESVNRALIIFTDGEELEENAVQAAREQAANFRVFTIGVGSKEGSLIPLPDERGGTSFVKDERGQYVKSRLDDSRLTEIAEASGGFYLPLQNGPATMKQIIEQGLGKMQEREIDARQSRRPIERYQWPLALGLALLASSLLISERRRGDARARVPATARARRVAAVTALLLMLLPLSAAWSRNAGVELYEQQNFKGAYEVFQKQLARNPKSDALHYDAGAAAYKNGDYDKALEAFSRATTARDPQIRGKAEYNLANTLVQRGAKQAAKDQKIKEWRNALQHYDEALKTDPKDENAKYNSELVRRMIEELEKEPPKQEEQKQEQKKDDQKKDQQQKNDQDQQQQQDSQNKDQQKSGEQQNNQQQQGGQSQQEKKSDAQNKQEQGSEPQKEQQGNQQKQDSQNQGSGEQKQAEQNKPGESGDEKDKTKSADNSKQQQQPQSSKGGQGDPSDQQQAQKDGDSAPQPTPSDRKLSGDIQAQGQEPNAQEKGDQSKAAEAAMAAEAAQLGEMSEAQARALVESLKGEDERVSLQERKRAAPVLKDW